MTIFETVWKSMILGTVQGLTEFLPVSSSGHLTLLQAVLGYDLGEAGMTFVNVLMHFGTLLAVLFAFRKEICKLLRPPLKPLFMLIASSVPAAVVGLAFGDKIEGIYSFDNPFLLCALATSFAVTAIVLLIAKEVSERRRGARQFGWRHAVPMGLMQAVALFPGISRSGMTIAAGTLSGAKREEAGSFSFLMSVPVILGSLLLELVQALRPAGGGGTFQAQDIIGMCLGVICSAVTGFFAIKFMLKVIKKGRFEWFSLYLILLSMTCFWWNVLKIG